MKPTEIYQTPIPPARVRKKEPVHSSIQCHLFFCLVGTFFLFPTGSIRSNEMEVEQPFNELFMTDLVYTQERKELQVGVMPVFVEGRTDQGWAIPFGLEYGLSDRFQIEAEWSMFESQIDEGGANAKGIGNIGVGMQYSFMHIADSNAHAALAFEVELPTGATQLSEGFVEYEPTFILAYDLPAFHDVQLFTTLGMEFVDRVRAPEDPADKEPSAHSFNWGAGMFVPIHQCIASLEFNMSSNKWNHDGEEMELYLTPGFTWVIHEQMEIGLGTPLGINESSEDFLVVGKLIFEY